jgi:hypothetical protein
VVSQPEVEPEEAPSETELISREEVETEDVETDETNETDETAKDDSEDTLIEEVADEDTDASEIIGGDVGTKRILEDRPRPETTTRPADDALQYVRARRASPHRLLS